MNGAPGVLAAPRGREILHHLAGSAGLYRLPVYTACTLLMLVINYVLGKDMLWDTLNQHLYAGFSALHERFAQDYFAAGPGSYLNPYAYVPFYLLASSGLAALASASLLAALHSTVLWLTYELAVSACPSNDRRMRVAVGLWAVVLALLNPVLIGQIGSSYSDITTAALVLLGWLLLLQALRAPLPWQPVCAGAALGVATALKLTNAVHAIAAVGLIVMLPRPRAVARCALSYAAAGTVGFAVVAGPWAWRLAQSFGNPFFPLLNNVFRSPQFTTAPLRHFRFIPASLSEALWRPFAIADPVPMVQVEPSAPDVRYAVLLALIALLLVRDIWQRRRPPAGAPPHAPPLRTRAPAALLCALAIDWVLWLSASGNGRYFLPMACITAVLLVLLVYRIWPWQRQLRVYLLAAVVAVQGLEVCVGSEYRWTPVPWGGGPWFDVQLPAQLAREPSLYLTLGSQSNSYLAPYLAPDSGLVNLTGTYPLAADGAGGARIAALLDRYAPHVRVLVRGERLYEENERHEPQHAAVDAALSAFGLRVDGADCARISLHGVPPDLESIVTFGSPTRQKSPPDVLSLVSCHVVAADTDRAAVLFRTHAADRVFDHLEEACPQLFQPRGLLTERSGRSGWQRRYINTDLRAWVSGGELRFVDALHGDQPVDLGPESAWEGAALRLVCGRRDGHYFARVLGR